MTLLKMDELNRLKDRLILKLQTIDRTRLKELDIEDDVFSLLEMAYMYGAEDVLTAFSASAQGDISPTDIYTEEGNKLAEIVDFSEVEETLSKPIGGKTTQERITEYTDSGDVEAIIKVVDTETHRVYNTGSLETASKLGATTKTWVTMLDERVRDTHRYIEGMTIPMDAEFYTDDGDHAPCPGQFILPENNVGCRCVLVFGKE